MEKLIIILLLTLSVGLFVVASSTEDWESYKRKFGKGYSNPVEETRRRAIFEESRKRVENHNQIGSSNNQESPSFTLGLNEFSDWTPAELKTLTGLKPASEEHLALGRSEEAQKYIQSVLDQDGGSDDVPEEVDWRDKGRVTDVKNQLQCGSCWAFSTTGLLEGQEAKFGINLTSLSEQNLLDCSEENMGCQGGVMSVALSFIRRQGGIDDDKSYPYEAIEGQCRFKKENVVMTSLGGAILSPEDEELLKKFVAKYGPVSVAIAAGNQKFQDYKTGVFNYPRCGYEMDHGVLVVGYGTDKVGGDYWLVKNSWGKDWGEGGYIRMARNRNNQCRIASQATISINEL